MRRPSLGYVDSVTPGSSPDELEFSPYDSTAYKAGDAVLLFKAENYIPNRQTVLQTAVIQSVVPGSPSVMTLDVPVTSGVDAAQFLYNGRKLAPGGVAIGATELTIPGEDATGLFPAGSWAFITDGVGVLATYGEYVRVLGADYDSTDTVLTIEGGVRNEYADDRAAVVPGRRADVSPRGWTEDVTVRGVTLGGTGAGVGSQVTQLSGKYCVDLKLERVRCALADPGLLNHGIIFITSGRVSVTDSEAVVDDGLRMNTCRDVVVERSRVKVSSEEFCTDLTFRDCDIVNAYAHVIGGERINAERCRFWNAGPGFANSFSDFGFRGCDFFVGDGAPVFYIQADRFTLKDVWSYGEPMLIVVQNGTGHVIDNVSATILLLDGTGGRITGPVYGTIRGDNMGTPLPIPGTWTRVALEQVSLALPTTVDDTAYVGKLSGLRSSIWARVSVTALGYGISIARQYLVGRGYSGSGGWYRCLPLSEGRQFFAGDDFDLEIYEDGNDCWLRVRRTVGTQAAELILMIETNATFATDGSPPTGSILDIVHHSTAASQRRGLLYATGVVVTRTSAPDNSDLVDGDCGVWFDDTSGAAKLMIKARDAGGTIRTGSVTLS